MENFLLCVIASIVLVIGGWMLLAGINKTELTECLKWQAQSAEYPEWYATAWQTEQCKAHGIEL